MAAINDLLLGIGASNFWQLGSNLTFAINSSTSQFEVIFQADQAMTIERIGLRYIDLVIPKVDESWQQYVQPGLRGIASTSFKSEAGEQVHQIVTETKVGGTIVIRVLSNPNGIPLPPDVATTKLVLNVQGTVVPGRGAAVVDIDHFYTTQPAEYDIVAIGKHLWDLKHVILEVWKDQVVTKEALEAWS
jgi:uncharacterized protein (TIGR04255 family)